MGLVFNICIYMRDRWSMTGLVSYIVDIDILYETLTGEFRLQSLLCLFEGNQTTKREKVGGQQIDL